VFLNKFHYLPGDYLQKAQQGAPTGGGDGGAAAASPENEDQPEPETDDMVPEQQ